MHLLAKCPLAKCPLTKCPLAKCPLAKWALVKCPGFDCSINVINHWLNYMEPLSKMGNLKEPADYKKKLHKTFKKVTSLYFT